MTDHVEVRAARVARVPSGAWTREVLLGSFETLSVNAPFFHKDDFVDEYLSPWSFYGGASEDVLIRLNKQLKNGVVEMTTGRGTGNQIQDGCAGVFNSPLTASGGGCGLEVRLQSLYPQYTDNGLSGLLVDNYNKPHRIEIGFSDAPLLSPMFRVDAVLGVRTGTLSLYDVVPSAARSVATAWYDEPQFGFNWGIIGLNAGVETEREAGSRPLRVGNFQIITCELDSNGWFTLTVDGIVAYRSTASLVSSSQLLWPYFTITNQGDASTNNTMRVDYATVWGGRGTITNTLVVDGSAVAVVSG